MENYRFEDSLYLVILGWDGGEFECISCASTQEVYQVLTDRIHEEVDAMTTASDNFTDGAWKYPDDVRDFAENIRGADVITDEDVILDCWETFFADSWWFKVLDVSGGTWLEYIP